jgi:ribonuclease HII
MRFIYHLICSWFLFWLKGKAMRNKQFTLSEEFERPICQGDIEEDSYRRGFRCIAGLDEVGRGPLAGPVVAAAVVLPRGFTHLEIKDSKLLTPEQRERLLPVIKESAVSWGVGFVEVEEIDHINILKASLLAMVKALRALRPRPDCLLIDGNQMIPAELFQISAISKELPKQRTIIKGDQLCVSIAAASIVAKVSRDTLMVELDKSYPEYGFASHKGYSCVAHIEALRRFGPSPCHRRSFKPVRDMCATGDEDEQSLPFGN